MEKRFLLWTLCVFFLCAQQAESGMIFESMPLTADEGEDMAGRLAGILFPDSVVIMEPGPVGSMDLRLFAQGSCDKELNASFSGIKQRGLSGVGLGTWVPFPEPNNVIWDEKHQEPKYFVAAFNHYGKLFKSYFPDGRLSLLLDTSTQISPGVYGRVPLTLFMEGIDNSLVDSVGIQGFAWLPFNGSGMRPELAAESFLNHKVVVESAKYLGVRKVWLNTGIPCSRWREGRQSATLNIGQWMTILSGILDEAILISKDPQVDEAKINIFAENKSLTDEEIDFSFKNDSVRRRAFADFVQKASKYNITVTVFE